MRVSGPQAGVQAVPGIHLEWRSKWEAAATMRPLLAEYVCASLVQSEIPAGCRRDIRSGDVYPGVTGRLILPPSALRPPRSLFSVGLRSSLGARAIISLAAPDVWCRLPPVETHDPRDLKMSCSLSAPVFYLLCPPPTSPYCCPCTFNWHLSPRARPCPLPMHAPD